MPSSHIPTSEFMQLWSPPCLWMIYQFGQSSLQVLLVNNQMASQRGKHPTVLQFAQLTDTLVAVPLWWSISAAPDLVQGSLSANGGDRVEETFLAAYHWQTTSHPATIKKNWTFRPFWGVWPGFWHIVLHWSQTQCTVPKRTILWKLWFGCSKATITMLTWTDSIAIMLSQCQTKSFPF